MNALAGVIGERRQLAIEGGHNLADAALACVQAIALIFLPHLSAWLANDLARGGDVAKVGHLNVATLELHATRCKADQRRWKCCACIRHSWSNA